MPTARYRLEPSGPVALTVSWGFGWRGFSIRYHDQLVATIEPKQLARRNEFRLPDGSILAIRLIGGAFNQELRIERNGRPLPGSASDPMSRLRLAAGMVMFVGGINIVLGILAVAVEVKWLQGMGISGYSILAGLIFLGLGLLVRRKSRVALAIAVALFVLDGICGVLLATGAGMLGPIGGVIFTRIFFLMPMIGGFKAFPAMKEAEQSSSVGSLDGALPSLSQEPTSPPMDEPAVSETRSEAQPFSNSRVMLIVLGILLISFMPFGIAAILSASKTISDDAALVLAVVPVIAGGICCIAILLRFAWVRRMDLCPSCSKPFFYHRRDTGRLLRCRRCGGDWTAGAERV